MRSIWLGFLTALFAAGSIFAAESIPLAITVDAGNPVPTRVFTWPDFVKTCVLTTPDGTTIQFIPIDNNNNISNDKYILEPDTLHGCRVLIKNVEASDSGRWKLTSTTIDESEEESRELSKSQLYDITVKEPENESVVDGDGDKKNPEIKYLNTIDYGAIVDTEITISLSKKEYTEECYLVNPEGEIIQLEDIKTAGVKGFPVATNFVSCRAVIGPMEEKLLGNWTLCGRHLKGQIVNERCQPVNISWAIENPKDDKWDLEVDDSFDYPVHFGGRMSPAVRGTGTLNTCHIITPAGEDITVTADSDYPNLSRNINRDVTLCNITISNIDASYIGNWTIYGTYRSVFNTGFNVVKRPMTFFLYDEENPHNQAYNVTVNEEQTFVGSIGGMLNVTVSSSSSNRDVCELITNTGEMYDSTTIAGYLNGQFVHGKKEGSVCRIRLGPLTQGMMGKWKLTGKFQRNRILFTEIQQPFNIIEEDPSNPMEDPRYRITNLDAQDVVAIYGESITMSTEAHSKMSTDSCHIKTPDGKQYILSNQINIGGVDLVQGKYISCGVRVHVDRDENIGSWTLIARVNNRGDMIEWRLPFTIRAEEHVSAIPKKTTIAEGSDLYLRLENPTPKYETCTIVGPTRSNADRDQNFIETCGYIVRNVTTADSGTWEIVYGNTIKYRASIDVNVTERYTLIENEVEWIKNTPVNQTIGPEDAIFCRVENPAGVSIFEAFGVCRITLDRVRYEHEGVWKLIVARSGRILTEEHKLTVKVTEPAAKLPISTLVEESEPVVILTCQMPLELNVTACKFRDPSGRIILAAQGIGEDRYSFNDPGVGFESSVTQDECGIRITNPKIEERGIWRCAFETQDDTYYGFLNVILPWYPNGVIAEPVLKAEPTAVSVVAGDEVLLRCNVQSPIQYCYFRTSNGTVFNVNPDTSEWYQYAGAGLDAGECSIRFPSLQSIDSGSWSCHVGFDNPTLKEQKANINLDVKDVMLVTQYVYELGGSDDKLIIQGQVYGQRALEYCRFVRIDGLGFKSTSPPAGYEDRSVLRSGLCELRIPHPTLIEQHPWTVVAKVLGHEEVSRTTQYNINMPEEVEIPVVPEEKPVDPVEIQYQTSSFLLMWACVLTISISLFLLGVMIGPKKNRQWALRRTEIIRNSLRMSLAKRPLPDSVLNNNNNNNMATPSVA